MPDPASTSPTPPANPPSTPPPAPPKPTGPTINIGEEYGTAKKNLPPAGIVLICVAAVAVIILIVSFVKRAQPQGKGSLDNIAAADVTGQGTTMVALTFTVRNTSSKILYVHNIQAKIKTSSGEEKTSDAVSAVDFGRYYEAFPSLKVGAQAPLTPETKVQPDQSASGTIIVNFPLTLDDFNKRQSTSVLVWPYDQQLPVVLTQ